MSGAEAAELLKAMVPLLRIRPVIDDSCRFGGSWQSLHAPNGRGWAQFHMVTRGSCLVDRPGLGSQRLDAGDILLLPHGDSHVLRSEMGGAVTRISSDLRNGVRQRTTVDARIDTEFLCGRFLFETSDENPLIAVLPDEIVLHTEGEPVLERFRRLLIDIRDELDAGRAGSEIVAADLARALFVMMLRDHLTDAAPADGMVSLLQDRTTARVVLAILDDLSRDWTLDEMAAVAIASRASLVRAFRKHAGIAPMAFLSDLRLTTARKRLGGTSDSIAKIASEAGAIMNRFSTDRLTAEKLREDHLADLVALHLDPEASRYLGGVRSAEATKTYLAVNMTHWDQHGFGLWVLRTNDGAFAGRAAIRHILVDGVDEIEIAYAFKRDFWGQGLASEIASALTDIGLSQLELTSLIGLVFVGNVASRRVLEKTNYVLEKSTIHHGEDVVIYRIRR